jgi:PAS domain-containing protein
MALYGFEASVQPTMERWLEAIHPDDRPAVRAVAEAALVSHAEVDHRFRIVLPDGSISWIQDRGRILRNHDGSPARLVGINIDVTELVELERRASKDGDRLRLALAAGRNACWDWDLVAGKVTWDDQLAALTGIDTFGGDVESFWSLVHDDDKPNVRAGSTGRSPPVATTRRSSGWCGRTEASAGPSPRLVWCRTNTAGPCRWSGSTATSANARPPNPHLWKAGCSWSPWWLPHPIASR